MRSRPIICYPLKANRIKSVMNLSSEVEKNSKEIRTDGYPMSIGELAAMYKDRELELHPEFQRYFRWSVEQKSRLVESILLGIPIPSIFVHQRSDGVWDVVDGLQRLSAIFETMGILRDENDMVQPPLVLRETKYLPSLGGKIWGIDETDSNGLGGTLHRIFKRSKIDVKIVLRESQSDTKLELFQRLNTGGTQLSAQELRNCQIIMTNPDVLGMIKDLSLDDNFINSTTLSERNKEEQYDLELVVRFIALRKIDPNTSIGDLGPFLDQEIIKISQDESFEWEREIELFKRTFKHIHDTCDENAFRRYDSEKGKFLGGFLVSAFEVLALGLAYNFDFTSDYTPPNIKEKAKDLWGEGVIQSMAGRRSGDRLKTTLEYGRNFLEK